MKRKLYSIKSIFYILGIIFILGMIEVILFSVFLYYKGIDNDDKGMHNIEENLVVQDHEYQLKEPGMQQLDEHFLFAFFTDENGDIVWSHHLPKEIPSKMSLMDVASFSKWYLKGYPVKTICRDDGILVLGKEKNTEWKYNLSYDVVFIDVLIHFVPWFLFGDLIFVILLIYFFMKHDMKMVERERTQWISEVSHDIRTPLALVLGNAEDVISKSSEELIQHKGENIKRNTLRMRTLISNMNTENKLSFGNGKWSREDIVLAGLVREVVCDFVNNEEDNNYEFDMNISEDTEHVVICGDRELVKRMLENIIRNSMVHNKEGCRIEIYLGR